MRCDVAIGAMRGKNRTPIIVSETMVENMKKGAVIMDVSIDTGGCFETSEITTHERPTFIKNDVIHYCVPNIPSRSFLPLHLPSERFSVRLSQSPSSCCPWLV